MGKANQAKTLHTISMWKTKQNKGLTSSAPVLHKPQYSLTEKIWFFAFLLLGAGLTYAAFRAAGSVIYSQNQGIQPSPGENHIARETPVSTQAQPLLQQEEPETQASMVTASQRTYFKSLFQQIWQDPVNIKTFGTELNHLEPAAQRAVLNELTNNGKDSRVIDFLLFNIRIPFHLLKALHNNGIINLDHNRSLLQRLIMLHGYHKDKLSYLLSFKPDLSIPYVYNDEEGAFNGTVFHSLIINEASTARIEQILEYANQHSLRINFAHRDKLGKTMLMMAVRMAASDTVKAILAYPEARATIGSVDPNTGMTELHYACLLGDYESAAALIRAGADVNIVNKFGRSPFDYLLTEEKIVKAAFKKMFIDPERDEGANFNGIGLFDSDCACHALIPVGPPFSNELKITAPTSQGQRQLLSEGAVGFALMCKHNQVIFENKLLSMLPLTPEQKQNFKDRFNSFTGCSLLQRALAKRPKIVLLLLENGVDSQVAAEKIDTAIRDRKLSESTMPSLVEVEETVRNYIAQNRPSINY